MSEHCYQIELEEAESLIQEFCTNTITKNIAKYVALGATLTPDGIKGIKANEEKLDSLRKDYKGILAWMCGNTNHNKELLNFFLSFEITNNYQSDRRLDTPDNDQLIRPSYESIFTYESKSFKDFLKDHKPCKRDDETINKRSVEVKSDGFLNSKLFENLGLDNELNKPERYYAFFEEEDCPDVKKFFSQVETSEMKYVRYYFGYSKKPEDKHGNIRVILIGVDKCGKNLLPGENKLENDPIILQRSWP